MFLKNIDEYTENIHIMQLNIGKMCNLLCSHCHVEANPKHTKKMSKEIFNSCIKLFSDFNFDTLDITGGEPTLHPDIIYFLKTSTDVCQKVILRTNAINIGKCKNILKLLDSVQNIEIFVSLPCYTEENVDKIRGKGSFIKIISGIRSLNDIGYGKNKILNLVYNPSGEWLPPEQKILENDYRKELGKLDIVFNKLFTISNQPIGNFKNYLIENNKYDAYLQMLKSKSNLNTLGNIMCRFQMSIDFDGNIFDCDFNQMLGIRCNNYSNIKDLLKIKDLNRKINFGTHCFACIAGSGSSCGGSLE